jgi:hypothetical protein
MYSPNKQELTDKIVKLPKYSAINADEAIKILYKQNWASVIQKYLNMLYAICRKENKITILCMPRFTDFNEFFRNHRIKYWIHVLDRGEAVLFCKDWSPFNPDVWFMMENKKSIESGYNRRKIIEISNTEKIHLLAKTRIYVGKIRFDKLPTRIHNAYIKGKEQYGYKDMDEQVKSDTPRASHLLDKYRLSFERATEYIASKGLNKMEFYEAIGIPCKTINEFKHKRASKENPIAIPNNLPLISELK